MRRPFLILSAPPARAGFRFVLAVMALGLSVPVFDAGSAPFHEPSPYTPAYFKVSAVRVGSRSADGSQVVLEVDYAYDGFGRSKAELRPVVSCSGRKYTSRWFKHAGTMLDAGTNTVSIPLSYDAHSASAPGELITDRVTIWAFYARNQATLAAPTFPLNIHWRKPAAVPAHSTAFHETNALLQSRREPAGRAGDEAKPVSPGPSGDATSSGIQAVAPVTAAVATLAPPPAEDGAEAAGPLSVTETTPGAAWLERLTLGAGDVMNISLFGEPELARNQIVVGPDGRISYLEAQDIQASGLTVDELRGKLDEALSKFRLSPRTVVVPVEFRSKKYYVLGQVARSGVYTLERPLTVIEAVARARGLETGLRGSRTVELADFSRSFLARDGKRLPVDFERLFLEGDLSQNALLAPGDYLYFPAHDTKDVYVLGEVARPGALAHHPGTTALRAVASRGGFTEQAWPRKLLVVRGSLNHPETFIIDARSVLSARSSDLVLQPRDIVYVGRRPWAKAEELLDSAASAFAQAAVIVWTGGNVTPILR